MGQHKRTSEELNELLKKKQIMNFICIIEKQIK